MPPLLNVAFGAALLVVGLLVYRYAYLLTWLNEQLDAVGSRTPASEVEPADWNVTLTRYGGAAMAVGGFLVVAANLPRVV